MLRMYGKGYYILYQYLVLIFGYGAQSPFISQRYKGRGLRTSPCICRENTAWFFAKCLLCKVFTGIHLWDIQFIQYPSWNTQFLSGEYVVQQYGWYGFSPISYDMAIEHSKPWQYNTICTDNQHRQTHLHAPAILTIFHLIQDLDLIEFCTAPVLSPGPR